MKVTISFEYMVGSSVPFGAVTRWNSQTISEWSPTSFQDAADRLMTKLKRDKEVPTMKPIEVEI